MITLKQYTDLVKAGSDKALLETAGIPAFLAGENNAAIGYGSVLGELRLQVQEVDADRAREVLNEREGLAPLPDDFIPPELPPVIASQNEGLKLNTKNVVLGVIAILLVLLALYIVFHPRAFSSY
ncbi:MAG: DUF2007 domain-containing protein [Methylacidiphilales bacterium]|nr:DUF2007 domain-containing protein [Candidatus Methylacidiphilales bacterium]